jgi:hypothetical protein
MFWSRWTEVIAERQQRANRLKLLGCIRRRRATRFQALKLIEAFAKYLFNILADGRHVFLLWLRGKVVVSHVECSRPFHPIWLEAVEGKDSAVSLLDWCDFQKLLESRQLAHVARARLKAAFKFANAAL